MNTNRQTKKRKNESIIINKTIKHDHDTIQKEEL